MLVRTSPQRFSLWTITKRFSHHLSQPPDVSDLIISLSNQNHLHAAFSLFSRLDPSPPPPTPQIYSALLHACARLGSLSLGRALHRQILAHLQPPNLFVSNHLINMYCKCNRVETALNLFDEMPNRNLVSWTALVSGYAQAGRSNECFGLFVELLCHHPPNDFAFASVLSSCADSRCIGRGQQVHTIALKTSFDAYVNVGNALVSMYSCCCSEDAWLVFDGMTVRNLITWNSMITGSQVMGQGDRSVDLFVKMLRSGVGLDQVTLVGVMTSCCETAHWSAGQCLQLHSVAIKNGFASHPKVVTALVKLYGKLSVGVKECYRIFVEAVDRDVMSWTGMITVCADIQPEEALLLFSRLRLDGLDPDRYTFSIVIKACAGLASERHGSAVHGLIVRSGFEDDTVLANALIHAYSRCGSLELSEHVFHEMEACDTVSWNTMIKAYAMHGQGEKALRVFADMKALPDSATFVSLLSACAHAGLVEQGRKLFDAMVSCNGIAPQCDHFACMVDMLGRAGLLIEAEEMIERMPMPADSVVWSALLGACRKHGETRIAVRAAQKLIEMEPKNSVGYVVMSNIYCAGGSFSDARNLWKEMQDRGTRKVPGLSWIEIGNRVHEFAAGCQQHPQQEAIYIELEGLVSRLKELGYSPKTNLVLHEVEEEHKEELLYYHSEKLALAFWLINPAANANYGCIKIMKNIRICLDCHNFMKLASTCIDKEIVMRDANRFHHFRDGSCSCRDYW